MYIEKDKPLMSSKGMLDTSIKIQNKLIQTPERRMDNIIADSSDWLDNCSFYLKNSHNENSCMAIIKTEQISLVRTKSDILKKILCENNHDNAL